MRRAKRLAVLFCFGGVAAVLAWAFDLHYGSVAVGLAIGAASVGLVDEIFP